MATPQFAASLVGSLQFRGPKTLVDQASAATYSNTLLIV
jgi:hypothetical protein